MVADELEHPQTEVAAAAMVDHQLEAAGALLAAPTEEEGEQSNWGRLNQIGSSLSVEHVRA